MDFLTLVEGPLLWLSLLFFVCGSLYRVLAYYLDAKKTDPVTSKHFSWKYVIPSLFRWVSPTSPAGKKNPEYIWPLFAFHVCLLLLPLFAYQHIVYWEVSFFGVSWPGLPSGLTSWLTVLIIGLGVYLFSRRVLNPELRVISTGHDYFILVLTILPFLTGYLAAHNMPGQESFLGQHMQALHILSGEVLLVAIPLTKLNHFVLFFFSRIATAVEIGRRGYVV